MTVCNKRKSDNHHHPNTTWKCMQPATYRDLSVERPEAVWNTGLCMTVQPLYPANKRLKHKAAKRRICASRMADAPRYVPTHVEIFQSTNNHIKKHQPKTALTEQTNTASGKARERGDIGERVTLHLVKGDTLQCKRPPFRRQKVTLFQVSVNQRHETLWYLK